VTAILVAFVRTCCLSNGRGSGLFRGADAAKMAETVNLYEAKTNLSKPVDRAAADEERICIIEPVARRMG
jgi:hypothetical protein